MEDNAKYPHAEFVLLDYNSSDGLSNWVQSKMMKYIENGRLKYYKTFEPTHFDRSHSKNLATRLCRGNVICALDADNYAGKNYAYWINDVFDEDQRSIVTTLHPDAIQYRDVGGKICCLRSDFIKIKGYDEALTGYGLEDVDLVRRLENDGKKRVFIHDVEFLKCLDHSTIERIGNEFILSNLESVYEHKDEGKRIHLLFFLTDGKFIEAAFTFDLSLKQNLILSYQGWKFETDAFREGFVSRQSNEIILEYFSNVSDALRITNDSVLQRANMTWLRVTDSEEIMSLVLLFSECKNRYHYLNNAKNSENINGKGWGRGRVSLNFENNELTL